MVVYLTLAIKMGEGRSTKVIPIVDRLDPVIDGVIFRMLRHHFHLTKDVGPNLRITQLHSQAYQSSLAGVRLSYPPSARR
jgi:hypothetical protein